MFGHQKIILLYLLIILSAYTQGKRKTKYTYRCDSKVPYFFDKHQPKEETETTGNNVTEKIVGGERPPKLIPWMASLRFEHWYYGQIHYCGGIILDEKTILTAAHCSPRSYDKVMVGSKTKGGQYLEIDKMVKNPYKPFDYDKLDNDVMILKLKKPIWFGQPTDSFKERAGPVCLPSRYYEPANGTICYISGWGKEHSEGGSRISLNYAAVPIIDNEKCRDSFKELFFHYTGHNYTIIANDSMICAGKEGVDSCQGDSGGPLVCIDNNKPVVVGVVSFGVGCGDRKLPGVYAKVTNYIKWIKAQMEFKNENYS